MYRKNFIDKYLNNGYSFDEAKAEVDFALDVLYNYTYKDFILGKTLENWQYSKLEKVIDERIKTKKPIQQLTGLAYFCGRKFFVTDKTLIPRPETELLVNEVLNLAENKENPKVIDIGTGSGCIPITLVLENKKITMDAADISADAIETAKKNALFHNVYERINFYVSDLFNSIKGEFDIIVSNPPYIPKKDKKSLQPEVRDYEPELALYTEDEYGTDFYEHILEKSREYLKSNGYIVFELGINQSGKVADLAKKFGYKEITVKKDFNSIERIMIIK